MRSTRFSLLIAATLAFVFLHAPLAIEQQTLSPDQVRALARDAYLFAYPIVAMDLTMRQSTNVPDSATINMRAPVNQFAHARAYPKADEKNVVRFDSDTLYSLAWLDLSREPMIFSVPDTEGRYYLLSMLDMWTDVFAIVGSRTTGAKAGTYIIVAPDWTGPLPDGVTKIKATTSVILIIGRTQTNGPSDHDNVYKTQDGYKLTPLSQWGTEYTPPKNVHVDPSVDNKTPPLVQVNNLDGVAMLTRLADLMIKYPPHPNNYLTLFRLRSLGIEPGKPLDTGKLDPQTIAIINDAAKELNSIENPNQGPDSLNPPYERDSQIDKKPAVGEGEWHVRKR
jgi:hypothetical protein